MQLLLPNNPLVGIAVEGLSPYDEVLASSSAVEIADLTLYYGEDAKFTKAERVEILQFKYSTKHADKLFRCHHAKKTLRKFAQAFRDYRSNYGESSTFEKLSFELITNRPIFEELQEAIDCIVIGKRVRGETRKQAEQFERATELNGTLLREFAARCRIFGSAGELGSINADLRNTLIDWSATRDSMANARLGAIKELVRSKAGSESEDNKVIRQMDVLAALGLSELEDLHPCDSKFPNVGKVVERNQLTEVVSIVLKLEIPLIVHAEGGVGKTVFMNSLALHLSQDHEVIVFDCFAGGAYRAPEDGRHLPERGLLQIVNELACKGLCDPILPGHFSFENLIQSFRKRLSQCVKTLNRVNYDRKLVLIIDAIDNAKRAADDDGTTAFPMSLIKSVSITPIPGVIVVASGRTHRVRDFAADISCMEIELNPFTLAETTQYLRDRFPALGLTEVEVAQARSQGNARILEYLANGDPDMLIESQIENRVELDELLKLRVSTALTDARKKGHKQREINTFLAGLSILPPPVPIEEYAGVHEFDLGAVKSFSADMTPLLELTSQGLSFRDEPTETFIREKYGENNVAIKRVAKNLLSRQDVSAYAAQALPRLLRSLGDGKRLFELALDERFPASISSRVGQRKIRHARLLAAIQHATDVSDHNRLVHLLVVLSSIASGDQRGTNYIVENPDLVANLNDPDAIRRVHTTRTRWPGSKHTRLLVMSLLLDDLTEAARCFTYSVDWLRHYVQNPRLDEFDPPKPDDLDLAAIPFYHLIKGEFQNAIRFLQQIGPDHTNEVNKIFWGLVRQYSKTRRESTLFVEFLRALAYEIGLTASALDSLPLKQADQQDLLTKLSTACNRRARSRKQDRLRKVKSSPLNSATVLAISLDMRSAALNINGRTAHAPPNIWRIVNSAAIESQSFLINSAIDAAVRETTVSAQDILPIELQSIGKGLKYDASAEEIKKRLVIRFQKQKSIDKGLAEHKKQYSDIIIRDAERYLERYFVPLITFVRNLAECFAAPINGADTLYKNLVDLWEHHFSHHNRYSYDQPLVRYFQHLGADVLTYALNARRDLKAASFRYFLDRLRKQDYSPTWLLIDLTSIAALKPGFAQITAEIALDAELSINREDDVTIRADLFADLARAVLPLSTVDANTFFTKGIDQLDAIGSGDHEYTKELLEFASSVVGEEISEGSFHNLTNICELNLPDDSEKFYWDLFGKAMSRTAGIRGLAKLSRWHDRERIEFNYTLMPYLAALVNDEKMTPEDAVSLNRLTLPEELWDLDSGTFISKVRGGRPRDAQVLIEELTRQFEENRRYTSSSSALEKLLEYTEEDLGFHHPTSKRISKEYRLYKQFSKRAYSNLVFRQSSQSQREFPSQNYQNNIEHAQRLASNTNPLDQESLAKSITKLSNLGTFRRVDQFFFKKLHQKLHVNNRSEYLKLIIEQPELNIYSKIEEIKKCKRLWDGSLIGLESIMQTASYSILKIHYDEFLDGAQTCRVRLSEVSELAGEPLSALAMKLVTILTLSDRNVPGSVWLCLGTMISIHASNGKGQKALETLLQSEASALSSNVVDGELRPDSYPDKDTDSIAAGLIWRSLGSPRAQERWYASHSIRYFARFGRWSVINKLVDRIHSKDSESFSANEICFYYLHAKLWLLVTLARLALDYPMEIARHRVVLTEIATSEVNTHFIFRHFAARTILDCDRAKGFNMSSTEREILQRTNESRLPERINGRNKSSRSNYVKHRNAAKYSQSQFRFEYDFEKYAIRELASIFDLPIKKVESVIAKEILNLDTDVESMFDTGGRDPRFHRGFELTTEYELYGQYLAWHGLYLAATSLLRQHPVKNHSEFWHDSWPEWLETKFLTRKDGLWLSDGMDSLPPSTRVEVLEPDRKDKQKLAITGDRKKLLNLLSIRNGKIGRDLVVNGEWKSQDNVTVYVSSALVTERRGRKLAQDLFATHDPFSVWLPTPRSDFEISSYDSSQFSDYKPWIVCASKEAAFLERHDPLSVIAVEIRPRFTEEIINHYKLNTSDPFQRTWTSPNSSVVATSEAWGVERNRGQSGENNARLICRRSFLRKVLDWKKANLILLIELNRYEADHDSRRGTYSSTFAVVRVRKDLRIDYFPGPINEPQESN